MAENAIQKLNYSHEALIDTIIANPRYSQRQLAQVFGYTEAWISRVMSSDAFKDRLAARRSEIVDPSLIANVEELFEGVARQSLHVLAEKLQSNPSPEFALKAAEVSAKALGYGARGQERNQVNIQQQNVIYMPAKSVDSRAWLESHAPQPLAAPVVPVELSLEPLPPAE